eukprot:GFYU01022434.1.p1 GENE.GFYU01022434.1~~GFYU01022434.1.p1  ORF type:complete len:401 (-),score=88.79 GFYU01022434.1:8-1210(-)
MNTTPLTRLAVLSSHLTCAQPTMTRLCTGVRPSVTRAMSGGAGTMRGVVLNEPGPISNLQYKTDLSIPEPTDNQVRVRVLACGVCHRDLLDRSGAFPFIQRPTILGHEIAGVVEKVAPGANTHLSEGDLVASLHWAPCGGCAACIKGQTTQCRDNVSSFLGLTVNGGYADYVVNGASCFVPVPSGWSAVEACSVMCTYGTVYHAGITRGRLEPGEHVLVTGATGGVGSAMVTIAKALGCEVTAVTSGNNSGKDSEKYLKEELGVHNVIVSPDGSFHKQLGGLRPVDMSFEAVGGPTFNSSLRSLRPGGRLVLVGNVTNAAAKLPLGLAIIKDLEIIGCDSCTPSELASVFNFMNAHNIRPRIASVLDLADVATAHEMLAERRVAGRVVVTTDADAANKKQ